MCQITDSAIQIRKVDIKEPLPNVTDLENTMESILRISEVYNLSPDLVIFNTSYI